MKRHLLAGGILAVFGALTIALGNILGLDLDQVALLGVALGGALALVPDRSHTQKIVSFLIGFALAWIGYAFRAAVLPDTATGRAVAVFGILLIAMLIAAASGGKLPLWASLMGAAALVGSYEATYVNSPPDFLHDSPTAVTTVLLAVAMGNLATLLLGEEVREDREAEIEAKHTSEISS